MARKKPLTDRHYVIQLPATPVGAAERRLAVCNGDSFSMASGASVDVANVEDFWLLPPDGMGLGDVEGSEPLPMPKRREPKRKPKTADQLRKELKKYRLGRIYSAGKPRGEAWAGANKSGTSYIVYISKGYCNVLAGSVLHEHIPFNQALEYIDANGIYFNG